MLLYVQLAFSASKLERSILELAANHHPIQLAEQFQRSREHMKGMESLDSEEQRKASTEEATKAHIIVPTVNKVTEVVLIDEEQPLSQAKGNVMRLEEQLREVTNQLEAIEADASQATLEKFRNEKRHVSQQVVNAQDILMQVLAAPGPQLQVALEEQKQAIIQQQKELLRHKEAIEAHNKRQSGGRTSPPPPKPAPSSPQQVKHRAQDRGPPPLGKRGGAFCKHIVENVIHTRKQEERAAEPSMAPSLSDTEQEMLCFLYKWEDMAIILQEETRLTPGQSKPFRWTKVKGMSDDAVIKALPDGIMGVIFLVQFSEMGQLKEVSKSLLQVARVNRLDLLIIMEDDKALFPSGGGPIEKAVPWHINDFHKLNRPLQTMGGAALHGFVVTSSRQGRKNCLAVDYQIRKLRAPRMGALQIEVAVPESERPTFAVFAEDRAIPGILSGMSRKGAQCVSNPHRTVKSARIVWHPLTDCEIAELIKAYKGCPFFAMMREDEFLGEEMSECQVVLQGYPKQSVKKGLGPYMWHTIYSSLNQHVQGKCFFSVQLAGKTKIKVGIKDTSAAHQWLTQIKYELETLGFNIKNERTGEPISDFLDGSDSDGSSSTRSTASLESLGLRSEQKDQVVFYDLLPRLEEQDIVGMLSANGRTVHSACRLAWTPGDISLSAWKLRGPDLKDLNWALLRDPKRKSPMFIMSLQQYNTERTDQRTKLRDKRSRDSPQMGGSNSWKSTYVNAVKGGTSQNNVRNR